MNISPRVVPDSCLLVFSFCEEDIDKKLPKAFENDEETT